MAEASTLSGGSALSGAAFAAGSGFSAASHDGHQIFVHALAPALAAEAGLR